MKKYFSPEYTNEAVMANDVITASHAIHETHDNYSLDVYNEDDGTQSAVVSAGLSALLGM